MTIVCALIGGLLVTDAVLAVTWQEPISALYARSQRQRLEEALSRLDTVGSLPRGDTDGYKAPTRHVQKLVARAAKRLNRGTATGSALGRIALPTLHANFVFVAGTDETSLKEGPGHYVGTALPGQPGTVGLAGHRTTYLAPFRHLDALKPGDRIVLAMPYGRFIYTVTGSRITTPDDSQVLAASSRPRLVLTACHPLYSAAERIIVTAQLKTSEPRFGKRRT